MGRCATQVQRMLGSRTFVHRKPALALKKQPRLVRTFHLNSKGTQALHIKLPDLRFCSVLIVVLCTQTEGRIKTIERNKGNNFKEIHHSDQGIQYAATACVEMLLAVGELKNQVFNQWGLPQGGGFSGALVRMLCNICKCFLCCYLAER